MLASAPIAGDQSEWWRPSTSGHSLKQLQQVRVEGVSPGDPVVPVAELVQADVVAVLAERLRERPVRGEILLDRPAAEHDRDRALGSVAMDAADEACDPLVAREVALVRLRAAEEAARLEKQRVEACPDSAGERGRARARRGSRRGRCERVRKGARAGSRRRARESSGRSPSTSRCGRPGRSGSREPAAARREGSGERSARRTRGRHARRASDCSRSRRGVPRRGPATRLSGCGSGS